ncbi:MAG: efflux RND transporter periplasmic adaptor subunit [Desulfobacterales bacterium]|nr:efflux RND transporter periplasmic adaptor subunit [Desulfobacterales bacterium]MDD4394043.1 efflux RND transporter periplasmic adaptor subunit [Desulfobacterales bacterium]
MQKRKKGYESLKWIAALVALTGLMVFTGCRSDNSLEASESEGSAPVQKVAVVTMQPQQITLTTELSGRTSPYRVAEIRPQVQGIIQKRLFTEGSDVKAGDVLYQIDPAMYQATLDNAVAALCKAEANLPAVQSRADRYRELAVEKAVSRQDYDDAAAALKQAEAEIQYWKASVKTARINLGYTRIAAPISGRIGRSNVTEGAVVTAYQAMALATIQQLDPIYVDVPQSTADLLKLKERMQNGQLEKKTQSRKNVQLIMKNHTTYPVKGTLQFQEVTVDQTTGSVILRAVFPNPDNFLLPGMYVRAVFPEGIHHQALLVPQQAVSRDRKGNPLVFVVNSDNIIEQRMPALDRVIGDQWLVDSGLNQGDQVVVEGLQKIRPGSVVEPLPFQSDLQSTHSNSKIGA